MNQYKLFKAGIDTNAGIRRFNGRAELYEKYLFGFPADPNFAAMCEGIAAGDAAAAFAAAHALKGVAGNLSLTQLHQDIVPLVEELRAGSLEHAAELLEPVTADYQRAIDAVKAEH